ncbi:hypothetical protein DPMN_044060 [Dreissena polymorpha]|uniref:Uncharacterized protein n=1 Tax=Dreissena polymorpha TaxID=45954 RepID=A0A9D4HYJ8_DREPO|nr:hypothetical protein DPMN_044060 [Dreissena polymorpha]
MALPVNFKDTRSYIIQECRYAQLLMVDATETMAEIVEDQLRSHVTSLPSFVRDTMDFLNKIQKVKPPSPEGTLIFCLDVKALYPNAPRD